MKFQKRIEETEETIQQKTIALALVKEEFNNQLTVLSILRETAGVEEKTFFYIRNLLKELELKTKRLEIDIQELENKKEYYIYFS